MPAATETTTCQAFSNLYTGKNVGLLSNQIIFITKLLCCSYKILSSNSMTLSKKIIIKKDGTLNISSATCDSQLQLLAVSQNATVDRTNGNFRWALSFTLAAHPRSPPCWFPTHGGTVGENPKPDPGHPSDEDNNSNKCKCKTFAKQVWVFSSAVRAQPRAATRLICLISLSWVCSVVATFASWNFKPGQVLHGPISGPSPAAPAYVFVFGTYVSFLAFCASCQRQKLLAKRISCTDTIANLKLILATPLYSRISGMKDFDYHNKLLLWI